MSRNVNEFLLLQGQMFATSVTSHWRLAAANVTHSVAAFWVRTLWHIQQPQDGPVSCTKIEVDGCEAGALGGTQPDALYGNTALDPLLSQGWIH